MKKKTVGELLTSLYVGMNGRCYYKDHRSYPNYGARGITICDEWRFHRPSFRNWCLEHGWAEGLEIDRIDRDGPYSPDNCRFVSKTANRRRQSTVRLSMAKAAMIRELRAEGLTGRVLAKMFECSTGAIYACLSGKTWQASTH